MRSKIVTASAIMVAVIIIDQLIKIYIKTHFVLHESYEVTSWFYLVFVENNGMAYGMELGSKLWLTLFRVVAVGVFGWYLFDRIRKNLAPWTFVVSMAMVVAGALGNIIDCVFYGRWFTSSVGRVAQWADPAAGLQPVGEWLQGRVVDMFYFPLIVFEWPDWVPRAGQIVDWSIAKFAWPDWLPCSDERFLFFKPVFNFADASISVGVGILLLLYLISNRKKESKQATEA